MLFIGDVHGDFQKYLNITSLSNSSLQIGDTGVFRDSDIQNLPMNNKHKCFRGNHDNPNVYHNNPNALSDYGYDNITEIFWMAGAYSIDFRQRTPTLDWWENEELSNKELTKAVQLYSDTKPSIMTSHDCPNQIREVIFQQKKDNFYQSNRTVQSLSVMFENYQPDIWIFGHHHYRIDYKIGKTRFIGLNDNRGPVHEQIFEVKDSNWN